MRIAVVGARGQLGAAIAEECATAHDIVTFTRADLDTTDDAAVAAAMDARAAGRHRERRGVHDVDGAEDHPVDALNVNAFAVRALARAAEAHGATLVHFSTDFVFDGTASAPYTEQDRPNPRSVYAASKLLGEWFALDAPRAYVLRVESLFGRAANGPAKGSVAGILKTLLAGGSPKVFEDRTISPTYVIDAARATRQLLESAAPAGLYHCVNSGRARGSSSRARAGASAWRRAPLRSRENGGRAAARGAPAVLRAVEREAASAGIDMPIVAGCAEAIRGDDRLVVVNTRLTNRMALHARRRLVRWYALIAAGMALGVSLRAETGYDLWLRYAPLPDPVQLSSFRRSATAIVVREGSPTSAVIASELGRGLRGLLGVEAPRVDRPQSDGAVIVGTPSSSPLVAALGWTDALARLGDEGYVIRSANVGGHAATVIASTGDAGLLYGAFHFLRLIQTQLPIARLDIAERPRLERRLLNHWDNLDGSIERGYAGRSLWWPDHVDQRWWTTRARTRRSGSTAPSSTASTRTPVAERAAPRESRGIARVFRPYGIRVYLAANFAAPKMLGGLTTDDPLDPAVARWWRAKADDIYQLIPDFGGFVVKANSEGQPGPQDYGRTHADGANVLADAVAPHGGIVMWRAFVYDEDVDPDRVKRAYTEFVPLDGKFRENVFAQVKNGPLDFQPREPFPSAVRRDAEDAADGGAADHAGVPRPGQPPRLPGADVEGVPRRRHARAGPRVPGCEGD